MPHAVANTEYLFSGVVVRSVLTGRETDNTFCLMENSSPGNTSSPVHVHANEDETIYVLSGEMRVVIAGVEYSAPVGRAFFLPKNVPHQISNVSGRPSRYIILCNPSGFDDFVAECGRVRQDDGPPSPPKDAEIARLKSLAPAYGITLLPAF